MKSKVTALIGVILAGLVLFTSCAGGAQTRNNNQPANNRQNNNRQPANNNQSGNNNQPENNANNNQTWDNNDQPDNSWNFENEADWSWTPLQQATDFNNNGRLDDEEIGEMVWMLIEALKTPHDANNPADELVDANSDGFVDNFEINQARNELVGKKIPGVAMADEMLRNAIDFNGNNRIDEGEKNAVLEIIYQRPRFWQPHDPFTPIDDGIDFNKNGFIEEDEINGFVTHLFLMVIETGDARINENMEMMTENREVMNLMDELADTNNDGRVGPAEQEQLEKALSGPHKVQTRVDRKLDVNKNNRVDEFEIERIWGMMEEDNRFSEAEGYESRTIIDSFIDRNKDGMIDQAESDQIVDIFVAGPHPVGDHELEVQMDANKNGFIEEEEVILAMDRFLRPHPVDNWWPLDNELDGNRDGFVAPDELGISAEFEGRIEEVLWTMESKFIDENTDEFGMFTETTVAPTASTVETTETTEPVVETTETTETTAAVETTETVESSEVETAEPTATATLSSIQKKLSIEGKTIAIVSLTTVTKNVDDETASGIMMFMENAFVNIGNAKVVDRANLASIMTELEFQMSDISDKTKVAELGKLTNAEIIVTGSISYVGEKYYMNIKLINVETIEILGSSLSDADSSSEFLDMCNEAVYKLF